MRADTVEIEELVLRVPGLDRAAARRLVQDVLSELSTALSGIELSGVPSRLELRLPPGIPLPQLARKIADQIVEALAPVR